MAQERVIQEMSRIKGKVTAHLREKINQILALCETFRWMGKTFTFDRDANLDAEVNRILIQLSDAVINDVTDAADIAVKESGNEKDRDAIMAFAFGRLGDQDLTQRIDSYSSHLKALLEGWVAIEFANKLTRQDVLSNMLVYMAAPYTAPLFRSAVKDGGFAAGIIQAGGYRYGKGINQSIEGGMVTAAQDAINRAYQHGVFLGMGEDADVIGYRIIRNSSYDCPVCDELTYGIHTLDEEALPAHPHCVCSYVPVRLRDIL